MRAFANQDDPKEICQSYVEVARRGLTPVDSNTIKDKFSGSNCAESRGNNISLTRPPKRRILAVGSYDDTEQKDVKAADLRQNVDCTKRNVNVESKAKYVRNSNDIESTFVSVSQINNQNSHKNDGTSSNSTKPLHEASNTSNSVSSKIDEIKCETDEDITHLLTPDHTESPIKKLQNFAEHISSRSPKIERLFSSPKGEMISCHMLESRQEEEECRQLDPNSRSPSRTSDRSQGQVRDGTEIENLTGTELEEFLRMEVMQPCDDELNEIVKLSKQYDL